MADIEKAPMNETPVSLEPIAVVGMSVRVPGANTLELFWDNLVEGRDSLTRPQRLDLEKAGISPRSMADPHFIAAKPLIEGIEYFDAQFFDLPETQAELTDPAHRLFLQCAWEAMEHAGEIPGDTNRATGVFAGVEGNYIDKNLALGQNNNPALAIAMRVGNTLDYLSLRVSHALNLVGPSFTVRATCSTSLLTVHLAAQSLVRGECDTAIAGGATINLPNIATYQAGVDGMFSTSGRVRPFDVNGDGTIFGNGIGVVVLKRLKSAVRDGNPVFAIIKGTGYCNDGHPEDKNSFIAPTPSGQKRAITMALGESGINPRTIGLVECHGTGTLLGDPIEVTSLTEIYRQYTLDNEYCAIGSVKANIGHLGTAAGVVSFIKTCLSLKNRIIPPLANYETPNPELDFATTPFFVNTHAILWENGNGPRRAGVSAFGFGGANAHVVLEEYDSQDNMRARSLNKQHLILISAKDEMALQRRQLDIATYIENNPDVSLADIAHTLQLGRKAMPHRFYALADDDSSGLLIEKLRQSSLKSQPGTDTRPVIFLFPGQGSQVPEMGRGLYENEPYYRKIFDYCTDFLENELGFDLRDKIFPADSKTLEQAHEELKQTAIAQPALFVVEYALARLYEHWGLRPAAMLGHSLGELVAACLAGVFSLKDGLRMVAIRSRLMQLCDPGSMLAVLLPVSELLEIMPNDLDLAAENCPSSNVVSGTTEAIRRFADELDSREIGNRVLATSHAFHSRLMDKNSREYCDAIKNYEFHSPELCVISNLTGLPLTDDQVHDPAYWAEQRRQPVKFSRGLGNVLSYENPIFVEVGPGKTLSSFVEQHDPAYDTICTMFKPRGDITRDAHKIAFESLGEAWRLGADIDWSELYEPETVQKVSLPTYPFQQYFHWKDGDIDSDVARFQYPLNLYEPGWTKSEIEKSASTHSGEWLVFSDNRGFAEDSIQRIRGSAKTVTVVEVGSSFRQVSADLYEIKPDSRDDMVKILKNLSLETDKRLRILHFWTLTDYDSAETDQEALDEYNDRGFHSLVSLVQAAYDCGISTRLDILIYTDGLAQVNRSEENLKPAKATLLGPCMVVPQELPGLTMRCIDILLKDKPEIQTSLLEDIYLEAGITSENVLTALRHNGRYIEQLYALPEIPRGNSRLRFGGTVLVTGGVGGLGLKIAEHLHKTLKARLVLTSRWQPPPRQEWPDYPDDGSKMGRALGILTRLVEDKAEILVVKADASSLTDMQQVIELAESEFGQIHGVVHAAGILDDSPVLQKTRSSVERVFSAKVRSAFILDELFRNQVLDIFIHFSSQASIRPGKGQVDYAAANAVLDRLSRRRQSNVAGTSCAIGWGPWRDVGMAWDYTGSTFSSNSLFQGIQGRPRSSKLNKSTHPILQAYRKLENGDIVFEGSLAIDQHWVTQEHIIDQWPVLSGTTLMELFHGGFLDIFPSVTAVEISRFFIYRPFVIKDNTDYEIIFVRDADALKAELRARDSNTDSDWLVVANAIISEITNTPQLDSVVKGKLQAIRDAPLQSCREMVHGPRWHCNIYVEDCEDGVVARVLLNETFHDEILEYGMHPAIFDRSIHTVTEHMRGFALPYTCQSIKLYKRVPAQTLVYGHPTLMDDDSATGTSFTITDLDGELVAQIDGYVQREFQPKMMSDWGISASGNKSDEHRIMKLGKPGLFDSFSYVPLKMPALGEDEVRIDVKAAGLNFRDVLSALGQLPEGDPSREMIGSECSGIVSEVGANVTHVRPGDRIVALANYCFATSVVANRHSVTSLPEALSFTEGASIPITYMTVEYALKHLAKLRKDEKVLIHAATGGIGLAAVQIAKRIGAEIFATAGNEPKRNYLKELGIKYVMNSRDLNFVDEINDFTDGEGVDVVLNALAGDYIYASMGLLKPFGRFLEIGKRDIYADSKMGMYPFRNNLSYFGVDLGQLGIHRQEQLQDMFEQLMIRFATGELQPGPIKEYSIDKISEGFEFMARSQHVGKIVFSIDKSGDDSEISLSRFRSRFGRGIAARDGLAVFDYLISSDATPPCVTVTANKVAGSDSEKRFQAVSNLTRPVSTPFREPGNTNEEILKQIWEKSLGHSPIGVDDDFQELGGDSLNAIMIQIAVEETFNVDLSLSVLFKYPTISHLAGMISDQARSST